MRIVYPRIVSGLPADLTPPSTLLEFNPWYQKFGYPSFAFRNLSPLIVHVMYVRTFFSPFSE